MVNIRKKPKQKTSDRTWLSWTTLMLGGMLLLFLLVLAVSTIDRLNRTSELMQDSLAIRGSLLVEYLESATRASLRGGSARVVLLSDMAKEIYNYPQLRSLTIIDENGNVLVSMNKNTSRPEDLVASLNEEDWQTLRADQPFAVMLGQNLLLGRVFEPFAKNQDTFTRPPILPGSFSGSLPKIPGYRSAGHHGNNRHQPLDPNTQAWESMARLCAHLVNEPARLYALVELSNQEMHEQMKRDMHGALLLALIIFVGCALLAGALTWLVQHRNQEIENMRRTVAQNQHLAAVGRLAGSVAHEVRNPLSSLRGLVQLMTKNMATDSKEANYARVAVDEVDRLERVVSSLLNYTRPRTPRFVTIDPAESLRGVLALTRDDPKAKQVDIQLEIPPTLPQLEADPDLLRQVLLNLIINALEAINGPGSLRISAESDEESVTIRIEDSGSGLPKDQDIFDPFYSTKPQGSGLGLAIAQNITQSHKGSLKAYNSEKGGAVMELKLRLKQ